MTDWAAKGRELYAAAVRYRDHEEWPEALEAFQAARAAEELIPDGARDWGSFGATLHEIATALRGLGDRAGAIELYVEARAAKERVLDDEQDWDNYSKTLHELGFTLHVEKRHREALEVLQAALAANAHLDGPARFRADHATLRHAGFAHAALGDWPEAARAHAAEVAAYEALTPDGDRNFAAFAYYHHGYALVELGDLEGALRQLEIGAVAFDAIPSDVRDHDSHAALLAELAHVHEKKANPHAARNAERLAFRARQLLRKGSQR